MKKFDRRAFVRTMAGAATLSASGTRATASGDGGPVFVSTWPFGKAANERAAEILLRGGSLLDAVEKGINVSEDDPAVNSVGYGGLPNA